MEQFSTYYLWRLFFPLHLNLDPDIIPLSVPFSAGFLLSVALTATMALGAWRYRRYPLMSSRLALILVSPLLAYTLFPLADVVAEHRAYITTLGAVILSSALIVQFNPWSWRVWYSLHTAF